MFGAADVSQKAQIPSQRSDLLGLPLVVCPVSVTNAAPSPFFGILDDVANFSSDPGPSSADGNSVKNEGR